MQPERQPWVNSWVRRRIDEDTVYRCWKTDIYSIYCAKDYLDDDIILMHGDLVFENEVFDRVVSSRVSCMTVSSTLPLPEKDFKAQIVNGMVMKVGVDIFNEAMEAQALYKLMKDDWKVWLDKIVEFCEADNRKVYAENALNELNGAANIHALDVENLLCAEIDNPEDLAVVSGKLKEIESRTVYMCFSTDIIHGGHIAIIKKAQKLGRLIIGVLSDEAVASYKRLPLVPAAERKRLFENIAGVYKVVDQNTLSYKDDAMEGHPHRAEYPAVGEMVNGVSYDGLTPSYTADGRYCCATVTHKATLGYIVECLHKFHDQPATLIMPQIAPGSFEKKLYSMYLSYLPADKVAFDLKMNCDDRGSFTELLKTVDHGQFSVNISKPGITKGQHWHNTKWEFFIVVAGHGLIQERKIGTDEVIEFEVSGDRIQAVHMLPGYTHNIINLSETENLVTVMWANEIFDPKHPDTFFEKV